LAGERQPDPARLENCLKFGTAEEGECDLGFFADEDAVRLDVLFEADRVADCGLEAG